MTSILDSMRARSLDRVWVSQLLADECSLRWHHGAEAEGKKSPGYCCNDELYSLGEVVESEVKQHDRADRPHD